MITFARFFSLSLMTFSLMHKQVSAQTVDWQTLNSSIDLLVQDKVNSSDFIETGRVSFDESKSNLSKGSLDLSFDFTSAELNLLSTRVPQKIDLSGQFSVNTTDLGSLKKVDLVANINLKGETLLILKHINELFADCASVDPTDIFQIELCNYIQQTTNANSAEDLQPAFESLKKALLQLFVSAPADDELKNLITNLNIVKINGTTLVSALVNDLNLFGINISGEISLTFSEKGILLSANGAALLNQKDYDAYINVLEGFLFRLQNQDAESITTVTGYSDFVFELLEGIFL